MIKEPVISENVVEKIKFKGNGRVSTPQLEGAMNEGSNTI